MEGDTHVRGIRSGLHDCPADHQVAISDEQPRQGRPFALPDQSDFMLECQEILVGSETYPSPDQSCVYGEREVGYAHVVA